MNNHSFTSQKRVPASLKWSLLIILGILVIVLVFGIFLYKDIQASKIEGYSETEKAVLNETELESVEQVTHFYGEETFHIALGHTKEQDEKLVFVPQDEDQEATEMVVIDQEDIMSKEDIIAVWTEQCSDCKLIKINPAMIKEEPLWEMTYRDDTNRYVIDYLSIYDGTEYEQYRFKEMFN